MQCPVCNFMMSDFDTDCLRCRRYREQGLDPRPTPAAPPAYGQPAAWPPAPSLPSEAIYAMQQIEAQRIRDDVRSHVNNGVWCLVLGFLCLPIVGYPLALYHGIQANTKGGSNDGTAIIAIATILILFSLFGIVSWIVAFSHWS